VLIFILASRQQEKNASGIFISSPFVLNASDEETRPH
jgi:hypothetical protein